jgi:hypothetical protein
MRHTASVTQSYNQQQHLCNQNQLRLAQTEADLSWRHCRETSRHQRHRDTSNIYGWRVCLVQCDEVEYWLITFQAHDKCEADSYWTSSWVRHWDRCAQLFFTTQTTLILTKEYTFQAFSHPCTYIRSLKSSWCLRWSCFKKRL